MTTESNSITRREALLSAIKGAVVATLTVPLIGSASEPSSPRQSDFIPENDYPFFGPEPESHL